MKKELTYAIIAFFCYLGFAKGQRHELGVQLGISNLVGDIGRNDYILQKPMRNISEYGIPIYAGIMYRMNFNPYQTVRVNLGYTNLQFNDSLSKESYRRNRKLSGTNSIFSGDILFEYNFLPVNEEQKSMLSPYIFGGISAIYMEASKPELTINSLTDVGVNYKRSKSFTMGLPFGIGLKYKFNYNWALSGEFTFRPTFSDKVDYSLIEEKDIKILNTSLNEENTAIVVKDFLNQRNIGNPNSKDWINSATIILSYSFGRPPCYCK